MKFYETELQGVFRIELEPAGDSRGWFSRIFCVDEFKKAGIDFNVIQSNRSFSKEKGILRGLHYQHNPMWEPKVVQCIQGTTYHVIADIRPESPTYRKWISLELSEENKTMFYSPIGCINGFQALTENCGILYFMGQRYSPEHVTGIRYDDPSLAVKWPLPDPILSERDKKLPFLT